MKCLLRSCCVLLCCLSLFIISSVPVSAESVDTTSYHIYQENILDTHYGSSHLGSFIYYPHNGTIESESKSFSHGSYTTANTLSHSLSKFTSLYSLAYDDNSIILEKGKTYKVTLSNVYFSCLVNANTPYYVRKPVSVVAYVTSRDGVVSPVSSVDFNYQPGQPYFDIVVSVTPDYDVSKLEFGVTANIFEDFPPFSSNYIVTLEHYFGEFNGDDKFQFALEVESQETGVLKSILNSLTSGLDNLFQGILDVGNYILELPSKLLSAFGDWIKSVFMPSDDFMTDFRERAIELCEEKFGALWEVCMITFESWDSISASDVTDTIEIPEVSIPLPDDNEFSFGGYDVQVVPDGFDFLASACKMIAGIACTFLFIRGLRKRYDEIMEVDS